MEKKECKSCKCMREMELLSGKNLTCDKCLEKGRRYSQRHPEKNREKARRYREQHLEEEKERKKVYMKEWNQREKDCEVCGCKMKIGHWSRHMRTKKHRDNAGGVEQVEKKKCWKCRCWRVFELYRGENSTCNICLGHRENWAKKNPDKVRDEQELSGRSEG